MDGSRISLNLLVIRFLLEKIAPTELGEVANHNLIFYMDLGIINLPRNSIKSITDKAPYLLFSTGEPNSLRSYRKL